MKTEVAQALIRVKALETEVQGMIAENKDRELNGYAMAYDDSIFAAFANEMREIADSLTPKTKK